MHKVFVFLQIIGTAFSMFSCKESSSKVFNSSGKDILGLAQLIQLQPDSTAVNLNHYFFEDTFEVVKVPEGLTHKVNGKTINLIGEQAKFIDALQIKIKNTTYTLPLRKTRKETFSFEFKPEETYKDLKIKGSFNGWDINATPLSLDDGVYRFTETLNPGTYEYVFVEGTTEFHDPTNPNSVSNGIGGTNSIFVVGDPKAKTPFVYTKSLTSNKDSRQHLIDIKSDDAVEILVLFNNQAVPQDFIFQTEPGEYRITLPFSDETTRNHLRVYAATDKAAANDILIPLAGTMPIQNTAELNRKDKQKMNIYSILIDRFSNGNLDNDAPFNHPEVLPENDYKGGDLQGVTKKISDGYFDNLGVNTLWLSPVVDNPETPYGSLEQWGVKTKFSGYHGYWPISSSRIEKRFGNPEVLSALIEDAHKNDMNILLDYVANHVHDEHPAIIDNPDWKTDLILPDGRQNTRLFDEQRLTTWFDTFMPSLDLEDEKVADVMSDSAVWWFKNYDIDGFRHDATKHIPNSFWELLTEKLKKEVMIPDNRSIYQIGETYGGHDLIASYVNLGMLDAQFDFNMYHNVTHGILENGYDLGNLSDALNQSLYYYGYHHVMGNISGNHDKARIISYADGSIDFSEDSKEAGYTREINNANKEGFAKVLQIIAFNDFIPGIPVLYYGDEIGMPGGNDPDCRRMMIFENWNEDQTEMFNNVSLWNKTRDSRMDWLYGDLQVLDSGNKNVMVLSRTYFGQSSLFVLNKNAESVNVKLNLPSYLSENEFKTIVGNFKKDSDNTVSIQVDAYGLGLWVSK